MPARSKPLTVVWVDGRWLVTQGVKEWTELPLWREPTGTWALDARRAHGAGLSCRPLHQTVRETWDWLAANDRLLEHHRQSHHGISPEREVAVLRAWAEVPVLDRTAHHLG
jgi:hypothetical protein